MFQVKNVTKTYGENAVLNNVSLSITDGMNFVVGSSGSGKTTLFKIMAGIDSDYDGEVYLCDRNMKELYYNEKSSLYNTTIGFIWQEFHLIESYTVVDNICLPAQLNNTVTRKRAQELIARLNLKNVADKQVKYLSGGQKQRVAIARELMKNPKLILADEPTSALDKKASNDIMNILRDIAKDTPVIVITHDPSNITKADSVFELDKGEIISVRMESEVAINRKLNIPKIKFPICNALSIMKTNFFCYKGRFLTSVVTLIMGTCFLLTMFSNNISGASQTEFNKLFDLYGESVLDISMAHSFIGASGTSNEDKDNPNVDVKQNLKGLYEKYKNDNRVKFITYVKAFDNISLKDGDKTYSIEASGNVPVMNKLITGRLANGSTKEIVVPESFVKEMNISNKEALGKKILFQGELVEWSGNNPTIKKVSSEVEIVGVIDSSITTVFEGKKYEYPISDSFFFSKSALDSLLENCTTDPDNLDILIRAKSPKDMISLKDELNKEGIVPLGNFEVIEDLVRLSSQSKKQSKTAEEVIAILALVLVGAISLVTTILRRKEFAIFKISGFSNKNLCMLYLFEVGTQMICSFILTMLLAPLINVVSEKTLGVSIILLENVGLNLLLFIGVALLSYLITAIVCIRTSVLKTCKLEEKL
ncbi:ATP-binding cassette domain-containing protein [Amedibacillus sp. YH-ame6]